MRKIRTIQKHPIFLILFLCLFTLVLHLMIASTQTGNPDEPYEKALNQNYRIYAPILPAKLTFAGENVPLEHFYVSEGLDREVLVNMYWQSNTMLIMKRAYRFFPVIEKILKEYNIPEDFKYLCVAESGLMNVTSSAKAQGYWQFIKTTGEKYGLEINENIDERNSLELSTIAACKFLKDLYDKFGSWSSAAAAYNCGESGMQKQIDLQQLNDYYHLQLYTETSRYLYRILSFKLIMENPKKYGYYIRHKEMYSPIPNTILGVDFDITSLHEFAREKGVSYKMIKILNPWIIGTSLPNKKKKMYLIQMPVKQAEIWSTQRTKKSQSTDLIESF